MNPRRWIPLVLLLVLLASSVLAQPGEPVQKTRFHLAGALLISPSYRDFLEDYYSLADVSGGYGWLGLEMGVQIPLNPHLTLVPAGQILLNMVSTNLRDDDYVNWILLPSGSLILRAKPQDSTPYLRAELSLPIPNTGADSFELGLKGPGFGILAGVTLDPHMAFELGYQYLPVEIKVIGGKVDENFGGPVARYRQSF